MLTIDHIQALMPVIDAGIRASGVQVFAGGNGRALQDALDALQNMAQEQENDDGDDHDDTGR